MFQVQKGSVKMFWAQNVDNLPLDYMASDPRDSFLLIISISLKNLKFYFIKNVKIYLNFQGIF
jgi:hypothetical protein